MSKIKVIKTDEGAKNGQDKCPDCCSTDISLDIKKGRLKCNYCKHLFYARKLEREFKNKKGTVIGSGAQEIDKKIEGVITLKCISCGAEVIINTNEETQIRCHWCRNVLSINEQVPNGSVPDGILPFSVDKEQAIKLMEEYVGNKKKYIHHEFKKEFKPENIIGVYLPYMVIDVDGHMNMDGEGEHTTRKHEIIESIIDKELYEVELYRLKRNFDVKIKRLVIESKKDRLTDKLDRTNNIINAVLPFDTENAVKWNANYIRGYSSEKRDMDMDDLKSQVNDQCKDIIRHALNEKEEFYDRGIKWENQDFHIENETWRTIYLPVWIYSYIQEKSEIKQWNYIVVNGRTKETVGSLPCNLGKAFMTYIIPGIILIICSFVMGYIKWGEKMFQGVLETCGFLIAPFFLMAIYNIWHVNKEYSQSNARHKHEEETECKITKLKKEDNFIKKKFLKSEGQIEDANNEDVDGSSFL